MLCHSFLVSAPQLLAIFGPNATSARCATGNMTVRPSQTIAQLWHVLQSDSRKYAEKAVLDIGWVPTRCRAPLFPRPFSDCGVVTAAVSNSCWRSGGRGRVRPRSARYDQLGALFHFAAREQYPPAAGEAHQPN